MKNEWNTHKKEGFTVPSGYFENVEEAIYTKMALEKSRTKNDDGFKVPEFYFEKFNVQKPDKKSKLFSLLPAQKTLVWTAVAAVLALVFLLWNPLAPSTDPLKNISSSSLNTYFENEDIQEYLTEEELAKIENNTYIINPSSISDDLIFDVINKDILEEEPEPSLAIN